MADTRTIGRTIGSSENADTSEIHDRSSTPLLLVVAAAGSALSAFLYFLIGFRVVTVLDTPSDQAVFGLIAGGAFLVGAAVLLLVRRRAVWIAGTAGLAFVVYTYFDLAPQRSPDFEFWGILIRVVQVVALLALAALAVGGEGRTRGS